MLRALILGLILFVAFGTLVPVSTEYSEASVVTSKRKYKKKKRAERYRRMALRHKRSSRNAAKSRVASKSGKRKASSKTKARKVTRRYRAKKKAQPRRNVRKKRKARRSVAKRRVKRSTRSKRSVRSKRKVRRSARSTRTRKRYRAKTRKRSTTRRSVRKRSTAKRVQKKRGVRKYSKKWWANYRAQQRRKKAVAARKRTNRIKTIRLAKKKEADRTPASVRYERLAKAPAAPVSAVRTQVLTQDRPVEQLQMVSGNVSMDVFGAAVGETVTRGRNTTVGGVSTVTLRRTVINQMIQESGWVENDYQKEVDGKKVYVVVAKAPDKNNRIQAKTYYFTESNGRIYRVAATSGNESAEAAQKRSEDMIRKLDNAAKPQQAQNQ